MKNMKKIVALVIAMMLVCAMAFTAFAAVGVPSITINSTADTEETGTESITYTYWKILDADIDTDAEVNSGTGATTTDGVVAYYVTTSAAANALTNTELFNVVQVGTDNKWYVELKDKNTSAQDIIDALSTLGDAGLTAAFGESKTFTSTGRTATSGRVDPGYYYIKSSLGSKIAIETLSPVTINEKNEYVTDDKTIPDTDKNSQIGQEITYTLTVNVPATANDQIVLTDTMSKGLTFKEIKSDSLSGTFGGLSSGTSGSTKFTITYSADQIKNFTSGSSGTQKITVEVTVIVNDEALIDTDIPNTLDLKYGNNYDAVPKTVNTKTTKMSFDKVDGTNSGTKLTGAQFQLKKDNTVIKLIEVTSGTTYRVATQAEIDASGSSLVDTITTNGNTVTINGLDVDDSYVLVETKAPTGYNLLSGSIPLEKDSSGTTFLYQKIENNKGTVLPSTGGMGTTILYIAGAILVLGAGILLVTRRRSNY